MNTSMPPITLKLGGKKEELPFSKLGQEELCNTWRLVAKVKDALEEGTRLENLSWRLWFLQNVLGKGSKPPKPTTAEKIPSLPKKKVKRKAPQAVRAVEPVAISMATTNTADIDTNNNDAAIETFKMHQFSSDQANDPVIPLFDLFGPEGMQGFLNSISDIPFTTTTTTTMNQLDYLQNDSNTLFDNANNFGLMDNLLQTDIIPPEECYNDPFFLNYSMMNPNSFTAFPNATLHNKLLATLPKQTLQSAERLLAPSSSVPQKKHPSHPPKKQQDYYYSTFQAQQQQQQQQQQEQNESHQICSNCDATSTPLWRRSADDQILCNACGLYLKLHNAPRPKNLKSLNRKDEFITDIHTISRQPVNSASKEEEKEEQNNNICSNCATTTTPLWRRDNEGLPLCNACGLYLKLHNEKRPLSMKTNTVKKRQRTDSNERYLEKNSLPGTGVFVMSKPTRK